MNESTGGPVKGAASERAVEALEEAYLTTDDRFDARNDFRIALAAACDPSLGEDRMVRLGAVLDVLKKQAKAEGKHGNGEAESALRVAAYTLAREFVPADRGTERKDTA